MWVGRLTSALIATKALVYSKILTPLSDVGSNASENTFLGTTPPIITKLNDELRLQYCAEWPVPMQQYSKNFN